MSIDSSATAGSGRVETRTIDMVPESERHGSPSSQFTLWFGANMQITAVVDGALAVVFGAEAMTAIIGLLIGNILGDGPVFSPIVNNSRDATFSVSIAEAAVPEPATWAMLIIGFGTVGMAARRRRVGAAQ